MTTPRSMSRLRHPPPSGPVLRVGLGVVVPRAGSPSAHLALADTAGNAVGMVTEGDEVEILGWRRGRSVDPHYRVRSSSGAEGWIEGVNLVQKPATPDGSS